MQRLRVPKSTHTLPPFPSFVPPISTLFPCVTKVGCSIYACPKTHSLPPFSPVCLQGLLNFVYMCHKNWKPNMQRFRVPKTYRYTPTFSQFCASRSCSILCSCVTKNWKPNMQWPRYPNPPNHPHPLFPSLVQPQDITLIFMSHFGKLSFWTFTLECCWHIFKNVVGVHSSAEDMWNEWTSMSDDKVTIRDIDFSCIFHLSVDNFGKEIENQWEEVSAKLGNQLVICGRCPCSPCVRLGRQL